ncbi:MAG: dephospho-CoA kinase [bacterium]
MVNKKLKITLTGGIGTGKSEATKIISGSGYDVIIADDLAKEFLRNDLQIRKRIIKEFGEEAYKDGILNTKFLAEKVFIDPGKVRLINSIVHPPTIDKMIEMMESSLQKNNLVFVESALVYEAELENLFDYVILIVSDEAHQIERVMKRDNVSEDEVKKRIENQIPQEEKKKAADFVIENNSGLPELKNKIRFIVNLLSQMVA